jgi:hypothetical protein
MLIVVLGDEESEWLSDADAEYDVVPIHDDERVVVNVGGEMVGILVCEID